MAWSRISTDRVGTETSCAIGPKYGYRRTRLRAFAAAVILSVTSIVYSSLPGKAGSAELTIALEPKQIASDQTGVLKLDDSSPQLTVYLQNAGKDPLRLWKDTCSWGYQNLSFELSDANDRRFEITRSERGWEKNVPVWEDLPPNARISTDVTLNTKDWKGLPHVPAGEKRMVLVRAVYRSPPSYEARANGIWVGEATSIEEQFTLSN